MTPKLLVKLDMATLLFAPQPLSDFRGSVRRFIPSRDSNGAVAAMRRLCVRLSIGLLIAVCLTKGVRAQKAFTWQEIRDKFEAANPTLRAGQLGVDEAKTQERSEERRVGKDGR